MCRATDWKRARERIPGGTQLVSKREERYCSGWPYSYRWANGCEVITSDGRKYKDFGSMGIGCCTLGYGNAEVDAAVIKAIAAGQFSSLNCEEELQYAEEILKINPKMDMVRFARTGGEACKIALEICKNYMGYNKWDNPYYAQHGYSGWILGEPERSHGIHFDTTSDITRVADAEEIACVIMEPVRNYPEKSVQLMKDVRKWCTENNVPLIFDEITSGFRENIGGYHAIKGIYPDIVVYGKAIGNGYPISVVVGKREFMEACENTFISSTFWSERIGYTAALECLHQYRERRVPEHLINAGLAVRSIWATAAAINDLEIEITGIPPLSHLEIKVPHGTTIFTEQMLKRGYLTGSQFYSSMAHTEKEIDMYSSKVYEVFDLIAKGKVKLEGEPAQVWKRPN